jgi:hypothetical protein
MKSDKQIREKIEEIQKLNESNQMLWLDTYIDALCWVIAEKEGDEG